MKAFVEKNKKYLIYLTVGIFLMLTPSFLSSDSNKYSTQEKEFLSFLENMYGENSGSVMVNRGEDGSVKGVIITIKGAENTDIRKEVTEAAGIAFNVPVHKIKVFEYKKGGS